MGYYHTPGEQRYTDQELAQQRAKQQRDDHAHARIDALQKELAGILGVMMKGGELARGTSADNAAKALLANFKEVDKQVEKKLGLR